MQFYKYFLKLCAQKGVSPSRASAEMGMSSSAQSRWRKTDSEPNGITIMKLSTYFGIPYDEIANYKNVEDIPTVTAVKSEETTADKIVTAVRKIAVVDQDKLYKYLQLMYPEAFEDEQ